MDTRDLIYLLFFTIIFLIIFVILFIAYYRKAKQTRNQFFEKYRKELEDNCAETLARFHDAQEKVLVTSKEYEERLQQLQQLLNEIEEKKNFNQTLYKVREEELNNLIENKKKAELEKLNKEVEEWAASAQEAAAFDSTQYQRGLQELGNLKKKELDELTATIEDYKARRDVINQEILRARAIEEQQDFYRVQLPESSKHDLEILQSIRKELTKVDILDKLLYDNYIKKSVDEMVKRVLKGENPSGIYKITRLKTGEIYIGKSVNVKDRWVQHAKSAFHCGTISHSVLHTTIEKDGIENFTWELLEEVPKDNLSNREKYWIDFFDSKNFGLNERQG